MATYHITTPQELQNMQNDLDADYILDNDLDMTGFEWEPVGYGHPYGVFTGTFDGQGFTISNLTCLTAATNLGYCGGLFGFLGDDDAPEGVVAIISNLNMNNVYIEGWYAIGAIAGFIIGAQIDNCHVSNVYLTCSTDEGDEGDISAFGSFAGDCYGLHTVLAWGRYPGPPTIISNCSATDVEIIAGEESTYFSGGFLGSAIGSAYGEDFQPFYMSSCYLKNCTISSYQGLIAHNYPEFSYIGGFVGSIGIAEINKCCVENFSVELDEMCYGDNVGGFCGSAGSGRYQSITNCYSNAYFDLNFNHQEVYDFNYIGGFCGNYYSGYVDTINILRNCYSSGNIKIYGDTDLEVEYIGGFLGRNNCYSVDGYSDIVTTIENCYTVVGLDLQKSFPSQGGFIGGLGDQWRNYVDRSGKGTITRNIINCSMLDSISYYAIGDGGSLEQYYYPNWLYSEVLETGMIRYINGVGYKGYYQTTSAFMTVDFSVEIPAGYWTLITKPANSVTTYQPIKTLSEEEYGTEERDNTNFFSTQHIVYAQGT